MYFEKSHRGHQIVCLTMPFSLVRRGPSTITACARQTMPNLSLCLTKKFNHLPTARASLSVYFSSPTFSPSARFGSQTFHSSKQTLGLQVTSFTTTLLAIKAASISAEVVWIAFLAGKWLLHTPDHAFITFSYSKGVWFGNLSKVGVWFSNLSFWCRA